MNWHVYIKPKGIERRYDEATYRIYGRLEEMGLESPRKAVMKNHVMHPRMPLMQSDGSQGGQKCADGNLWGYILGGA